MRVISIFTREPWGSQPPDPQMMAKMNALIQELTASGVLVDTGGITPTGVSLRIKSAGSGPLSVTDGPFAESKEIVGGYAVLDVRDRKHLVELTQRFLECAGGGTCTIHELAEMPGTNTPQ
ncbi:MAG TPA: YciI family protein [Candidatus Acidoferrales bacterium]|nr:YciI family protein [Candidatus Acidoferrales bacterium]